jgi:hypothetical protein
MIYEVRTYTLRPGGAVAAFEERFAKRLPLREKHSKLGAFWHTEFGPLNQRRFSRCEIDSHSSPSAPTFFKECGHFL